jgi:hypothetical protein
MTFSNCIDCILGSLRLLFYFVSDILLFIDLNVPSFPLDSSLTTVLFLSSYKLLLMNGAGWISLLDCLLEDGRLFRSGVRNLLIDAFCVSETSTTRDCFLPQISEILDAI